VSIVSLLALVIGFIALFWIIELQWLRRPRRYRALPAPPSRRPIPRIFSRAWFADMGRSLLAFVILLAVALLLVALFGH
jgi:hypothetical protein